MWMLATLNSAAPAITAAGPSQLDVLMLMEFLTAVLTLVIWLHLKQSRSCVLALGICLMAMTVFAFLQGAWPLGIVTSVWSIVTVRRWLVGKDIIELKPAISRQVMAIPQDRWESQSRFFRMSGLN